MASSFPGVARKPAVLQRTPSLRSLDFSSPQRRRSRGKKPSPLIQETSYAAQPAEYSSSKEHNDNDEPRGCTTPVLPIDIHPLGIHQNQDDPYGARWGHPDTSRDSCLPSQATGERTSPILAPNRGKICFLFHLYPFMLPRPATMLMNARCLVQNLLLFRGTSGIKEATT